MNPAMSAKMERFITQELYRLVDPRLGGVSVADVITLMRIAWKEALAQQSADDSAYFASRATKQRAA